MSKLFYYLNEQNSKSFKENSQNKFGLISGEEYGYIISGGNQYSPSYTQVKNQIIHQIDERLKNYYNEDEINSLISNLYASNQDEINNKLENISITDNQLTWNNVQFRNEFFSGSSADLVRKIGLEFDNQTTGGIPIYDDDLFTEMSNAGKLPDKFLTVRNPRDIYKEDISTGDTYLNQIFSAIRTLQAEITKIKNTFKYGLESYQGKQTAMSSVLETYDDVETQEPLWAINENGLSAIDGFEFNFDKSHKLQIISGNIETGNESIKINGHAKYSEPNLFKNLKDSYLLYFLTLSSLDMKVKLESTKKVVVPPTETPTEPPITDPINFLFDFSNLESLNPPFTFQLPENSGEITTNSGFIFENGKIKVTVEQGISKTKPRFWKTTKGKIELRLYNGNSLIIESIDGTVNWLKFSGDQSGKTRFNPENSQIQALENGEWNTHYLPRVIFTIVETVYMSSITAQYVPPVQIPEPTQPSDTIDIEIDFSQLKNSRGEYIADTRPDIKKNIMIVISRAHPDNPDVENPNYFGKNYIYISINYWDKSESLFNGYLNINQENKLYESELILGNDEYKDFFRYYPVEFEFNDLTISKFDAYTRFKDFSNEVLPSQPNEVETNKYKVAHIAVRSFDTIEEAKEIKDQLIENELLFITNTNKLYIKSKGKIVGISGAGDNNLDDDETMTQEQLINELKQLGIVYTSDSGSLELSSIADITFVHNASGKRFNFECNAYGELVCSEVRNDTIENRLKAVEATGKLSNDFEDIRGLIGQLCCLENGKKSVELTKDAGLASDRIRIGAVYCPLATDTIFGATHGFIELANASQKDLNLEGCYLSHCFPNDEGTMQTISLPLKGVLPAGGTFLIRCKQYAKMADPNAFIKVDDFDMEWYHNNQLVDLTIHPEYITIVKTNEDGTQTTESGASYGFLLTYGNKINGSNISHTSKPFLSKVDSVNPAVSGNTKASNCYANNFIDSLVLNSSSNCAWVSNICAAKSNTMVKVTFMLDPAKQALNGLYESDSSRIRWANIATDYQYVVLKNEFISFKHSDELYPISNYTPRSSKYGKHVCTDKTQLNKEKPNCVYTSFGIDTLNTRCFSWISVGAFDEYVWIKDGESYKKFESYKTISDVVTPGTTYPLRKEFPVDVNNTIYSCITKRFPADNSLYCTHKCIIQLVEEKVETPTKYEYIVGRADKNGNPDFAHCSDVMEFTLYPDTYKPIIYHTSDQQGFHWIEYQVWNAAAKKLEEKIKEDCDGKEFYPVIINTGDMTQNGTRINEWLDYYNGGYNLFSKYEHAAVVGNNDLCDTNPEILGTGDDIGKSSSFFFNLFFCYEVDITKTGENYNIPLPIVNNKYIPSTYYIKLGGSNTKMIMLNSEITKVNCQDWFGLSHNNKAVNIYTGFTIASGNESIYVADTLGFTPIYEMIYKMTDDKSNYIVVCHESPFTVITNASLSVENAEFAEDRSISGGSSLVGSHTNIIHVDSQNSPGLYWLSRLLEYRGIKLCLCGHKHTYACTYPIRENFQFYNNETNEWVWTGNTKYTMPPSLKDEVDNSEGGIGQKIKWIWNDEIISGVTWQNVNHTKFPLVDKNIVYSGNDVTTFYPVQYCAGLKDGVRYFMCQATGYKLTSNKELPSPEQRFSEFIPKTTPGAAKDTPDNNQKYPMFAIINITNNEYILKLARICNIFNGSYKFTQEAFGKTAMTLQYLKENKNENNVADGYGVWVNNEDSLFTCNLSTNTTNE